MNTNTTVVTILSSYYCDFILVFKRLCVFVSTNIFFI